MQTEDEISSRQRNLEDELCRVKATVASLDSQINVIKQNAGWNLEIEPEKLSNEATANLWKKLIESGPVAEAYHDLPTLPSNTIRTPSVGRGKKQKVSARSVGRGRSLESPKLSGFKRHRVLTSKEKRIETLWSQCGSILNQLKKHQHGWPFTHPVDAEALNIPDYYEVIKHPIDLGTISRKMEHDPKKGRYRDYKTPIEFRDDVRLVWSNCQTYNKLGEDVRTMGDMVSEVFEKKWSQSDIETKWLAEQQSTPEDEEGDVFMEIGLKEKRRGSKELSMSFLDKRRLAQQIGSFNSEQAAVISELLQTLNISEEGDEIVLNLEQIDAQTLWTIKQKVDTMLTTKVRRTAIQP